jgi:4-carboxymuconolactone decarboxylase
MRLVAAILIALTVISSTAQAKDENTMARVQEVLSRADIQAVSPALDQLTQERLLGEVWKRPGLGARDRSVVTLAALIARNQTVELPFYLNRALDSGLKPSEI